MAILVDIDVMLARRKMAVGTLAEHIVANAHRNTDPAGVGAAVVADLVQPEGEPHPAPADAPTEAVDADR